MEVARQTRILALSVLQDTIKTLPPIPQYVSLNVETVKELGLKNEMTIILPMEMAASLIAQESRAAGYVMEEVQQTKILVPIVQLGSTRTMLHILLNVSLIVEMVSELDPRNEMMITQLMEMAVNQTALLSSRAGYEMEEARQVKTRAIFELLDFTKTMLHIRLNASLIVEMVSELGLRSAMTITLPMEMVVNLIDQVLRVAGYEMGEALLTKTHVLSVIQVIIRMMPHIQLSALHVAEMVLEQEQSNVIMEMS